MTLALLALAAVGHAVLWAAIVNRLHGTAIKQSLRTAASHLCLLLAAAIPLAIAAVAYRDSWLEPKGVGFLLRHENLATYQSHQSQKNPDPFTVIAWTYVSVCAIACIFAAVQWIRLRRHAERRGALVSNHTTLHRPRETANAPLTAPGIPTLLSRLPGNQILEIRIHEKELAIPRLAPAHDGLRIAHLTDLHMSGRITKAYFHKVVDEVNRAQPDLIAITGDIVERRECLDWLPDTLGRLRAPGGIYYVLGNHDRRVDYGELTSALADAGLKHLGGRWEEIAARGAPLILAGNELPWFTPAADLTSAPADRHLVIRPTRILLAHTPDQFRWAQQHDFELVLAGHLHGGQVCLPLVGPMLAPSLYGVRYASGVFRAGGTVLHVSRGTSGLTPLRFNCPPEIAILTLRRALRPDRPGE
jgi:uncharacterized protein